MDLGLEYRLMCLGSSEIQNKWNPSEGDFMLAKASYCSGDNGENENNCTDDNPCTSCLEIDNGYVISGKYDFSESVGGTHWFYGGSACISGSGCQCNDTQCYVMTNKGRSTIQPQLYGSHPKNGFLWMPRQDQIQSMFLNGLTEHYKVRKFIEWLDYEAEYNPHTYSLEMLWLMFYMDRVQGKIWNAMENIKKWEIH